MSYISEDTIDRCLGWSLLDRKCKPENAPGRDRGRSESARFGDAHWPDWAARDAVSIRIVY